MTGLYNLLMLPAYAVWRVVSRIVYLVSGWWFWKRVFGLKTGDPDAVAKALHR